MGRIHSINDNSRNSLSRPPSKRGSALPYPTVWVRIGGPAYFITPHWLALPQRSRRIQVRTNTAPIGRRRIRASRPDGVPYFMPHAETHSHVQVQASRPPCLASPRRRLFDVVRRQSLLSGSCTTVCCHWYKECGPVRLSYLGRKSHPLILPSSVPKTPGGPH